MFKCICGYTSYFKDTMHSHMRSCLRVKRELRADGVHDTGFDAVIASSLFDSLCCDTSTDFGGTDFSSGSSGDSFSGGGGDFGGGGTSGDW